MNAKVNNKYPEIKGTQSIVFSDFEGVACEAVESCPEIRSLACFNSVKLHFNGER
jgi:hypothetical protein